MPDNKNLNGYDESFWKDVDALRAMLDEENENPSEPPVNPVSQHRTSESPQNLAAPELNLNFRNQNLGTLNFEDMQAERSAENERKHSVSRSSRKNVRAPRRASRGLLITLYTIIVLELAAIVGIGAAWYLWIQ